MAGTALDSSYYDQDEVWRENYWTQLELERATATAHLLPEGIRSVLDVGCGAGIVTKALAKKASRVVGTDYVRGPLEQVQAAHLPAIRSDAQRLPFADKSFDAVAATEVIEHFTAARQRAALDEFARVARSHVLITVPYREVLESGQLKCGECGCVFHGSRHTTSFDERRLRDLLAPAFALERTVPLGPTFKRIPRPLKMAAQLFGGYARPTPGISMCPQCGNQAHFVLRNNIMTKLLLGIPIRLLPIKPRERWIAALYERREV